MSKTTDRILELFLNLSEPERIVVLADLFDNIDVNKENCNKFLELLCETDRGELIANAIDYPEE